MMAIGIDFWNDFDGFSEGKRRQVGTNMGAKLFENPENQKSIFYLKFSYENLC